MPSSRSPCNSARSICFELVNSRIAVRISTEAAIVSLPFPVKRQPRLLDGGERKAPLIAALIAYSHHFVSNLAFDVRDLDLVRPAPRRITRHVGGDDRCSADVFPPVSRIPQGSFDSRGRSFEHVIPAGKIVGVQPVLDCPRRRRAIVDSYLLTILPIDTNVENGSTPSTRDLQLEKL